MKLDEIFANVDVDQPSRTVWSRRDGSITRRTVHPAMHDELRPRTRIAKPDQLNRNGNA